MAPLAFPGRVTIATPLVTLTELKDQLHVTDTAHDTEITRFGAVAQAAILAYLTASADPAWTAATAPLPVKHAILLLADNYHEYRGDDSAEDKSDSDHKCWDAIGRLLAAYRDPTLA